MTSQHQTSPGQSALPPDADVIIIGAGPAGMSAAIELAGAGKSIIVLDMQPAPGGQVYRNLEANLADRPATGPLLAALGPSYLAGETLIRTFRATPGIDFRPLTTVWELRPDGTVGWQKEGQAGFLRARHVILASGAMERPVPFPGWTLPGVMTAGAVQTLLKAGRLQPEGRIVLAGTGPLIFLLANQLLELGVKPALIARTDGFADKIRALKHLRPAMAPALLKGMAWASKLRRAGVQIRTGMRDLRAEGAGKLEHVTLSAGGKPLSLDCDLLVVHDGIIPTTDLAQGAGLALRWNADQISWQPVTDSFGKSQLAPRTTGAAGLTSGACRIHVSGDARLIGGAEAAEVHGKATARAVLAELGKGSAPAPAADVAKSLAARPFIDTAFPIGLAAELPRDNDTILCRCEEFTIGSARAAVAGGATDMNLVRGTLRCGMGPCQGRNCTISLARVLTEAGHQDATAPEQFRARPPARPVTLGALMGLSGLDPQLSKLVAFHDEGAEADDKVESANG